MYKKYILIGGTDLFNNKKVNQRIDNLQNSFSELLVEFTKLKEGAKNILDFNDVYDKLLDNYKNSKKLINEQLLQFDKKIIENSAVFDDRMLQFTKKIDSTIDNTISDFRLSIQEQSRKMKEEMESLDSEMHSKLENFLKEKNDSIVNDCKELLEEQRKVWDKYSVEFANNFNLVINKYELNISEMIKHAVTLELNDLVVDKIVNESTNKILDIFNKSLNELNQKEKDSIIEAIKSLINDKLPIKNIDEEIIMEIEPLNEKDVLHESYSKMKTCILAGVVPMLVGPAGTGKSTAASQLARDLGLQFYMANRIQNTFELLGFVDAKGDYVKTQFYEAFTKGGLFLFDEVDASSPEALVTINAALAQGYMAFPGQPNSVKMHPDFKVVCAGNTYGKGSTRQYTGRNKLDAATLDRFMIINWDYDKKLEDAIVSDKDLLNVCWRLREVSRTVDETIIISTRGIVSLEKMIKSNSKEKTYFVSDLIKSKFFETVSHEDLKKIVEAYLAKSIEKNKYNKYISEMIKQ